jgi:hypothetical protein
MCGVWLTDVQLIAAKLKGVHSKDVSNSSTSDPDTFKMVYSDIICGGAE